MLCLVITSNLDDPDIHKVRKFKYLYYKKQGAGLDKIRNAHVYRLFFHTSRFENLPEMCKDF